MTDKELRKLKREDFVEIIYQYQRREQKLLAENNRLKAQLADRYTRIENAGSIAEAALSLNKVLESVQSAADQYLEEIKTLRDQAARGELQIPQPQLPEIPDQPEDEASRKWDLDEISALLNQSEQEQENNPFDDPQAEPQAPRAHKLPFHKPGKQTAPPPFEDDGSYVPQQQNAAVENYERQSGYQPVTRPEDMTMEDIDLLLDSLKDI